MVIKDGISLVISEFYTALVKDGYRPLRVVSAANLLSIEPSLAKDMAESYRATRIILSRGVPTRLLFSMQSRTSRECIMSPC